MAVRKGIGELLVRENLIDVEQLDKARRDQKQGGGKLTSALVRLGYLNERELTEFMGKQYGLPTLDLSSFEIDPEVTKLISVQVCRKHTVMPVQKSGRSLVVAFADPTNIYVKDDLSILTRLKIEVVVAPEAAISEAIDKYYGVSSEKKLDNIMQDFEDSDEQFETINHDAALVEDEAIKDDGPVINFVNAMLAEAIKVKASDIHVEVYENRMRIRLRIDGTLIEKNQPPQGTARAIISRVKIMSKMDIAERRKPQDGRLKVRLKNGTEVDFRVNSVPTIFGEKIVLRILDKSNLQVDLTKLGMEVSQIECLAQNLSKPQGMILITGPTGSGKTTTVYSCLAELNTPGRNITTAEDPVEFNLDGINQVQMNPIIGFNFPDALRAFLRQDPEIIMVGEVRDYETAGICYKAASTGHLVISTLHTNDAPSTITRLMAMGVPAYMVAESTSLVVAQRLVRKICENCAVPTRVEPEQLIELGVPEDEVSEYNDLRKGEGCSRCGGTGSAGRVAVFEVLEFKAQIKDAISKSLSTLEVKRAAIGDGLMTLRQHALLKLKQGLVSVQEVVNATVGDDIGDT